MNQNHFNFPNYHNPIPNASSPHLPWLDPKLASDYTNGHESQSSIASRNDITTGNGHFQVHTSSKNLNLLPDSSILDVSQPHARTIVTQAQLSDHLFLMSHSPRYVGLYQAYMEASIELRTLKAYSANLSTSKRTPLSSRTSSVTQTRHNQSAVTVTKKKLQPLPSTTTLPPLNKDDYSEDVMWTKKAWSADEKARKNKSEKVSLYDFLRDEDGKPPGDEEIAEMRDMFKQACCRLELAGLRPRKWKRCVPEALRYIQNTLCAVFPVFRYANNDWKVQKFGSRVYPDWNRDYETDSESDIALPKRRKKRHHGSSDSDSDSDNDDSKKRTRTKPTKRNRLAIDSEPITKGNKKAKKSTPPAPSASNTIPSQPPHIPPTTITVPAITPIPSPPPSSTIHANMEPSTTLSSVESESAITGNSSLAHNHDQPSTSISPAAAAPSLVQPESPPVANLNVRDDSATTNFVNTVQVRVDEPLITGNPAVIVDPSASESPVPLAAAAVVPTSGTSSGTLPHPSRVTRASKFNKKPNPLLGVIVPKPATEIAHSETAPEVRTRGGSKVMEPHPTHLSAKNMYAHEVKKTNPEITQDEFNNLFEKLTPAEKKAYEKLGKAKRAELKKTDISAAAEGL